MEQIKQTAVNYLIHSIHEDMFQLSKSESEWKEIFEQAKAMEKEQIITSYKDGRLCIQPLEMPLENEYYQETYGK